MIDIIIPYRHSNTDELRMTLRSIEMYFPPAHIIISGDVPIWAMNVTEIHNERRYMPAQLDCEMNIYKALDKVIGDDFYLWNDDFMLLKPMKQIKHYYEGAIRNVTNDKLKYPMTAPSGTDLIATELWLLSHGYIENKAYTLHIPVKYNVAKYRKMSELIQPVLHEQTILPRTIYGNMYDVGGTQRHDCKIYFDDQLILDDKFVATWDETWNGFAGDEIHRMFPNVSKYERGA